MAVLNPVPLFFCIAAHGFAHPDQGLVDRFWRGFGPVDQVLRPKALRIKALTARGFHCRPGAACNSTLVRKANAGDLAGACNELPRWNKAGGRIIPGLSNRRGAERAMCHQALKAAA